MAQREINNMAQAIPLNTTTTSTLLLFFSPPSGSSQKLLYNTLEASQAPTLPSHSVGSSSFSSVSHSASVGATLVTKFAVTQPTQ